MCGRFSLVSISTVLTDRFKVEINEPIKPRYNIAPGQDSLIIMNTSPNRISTAKWGLIPHWSKDEKTGYKMINARAETLMEKPAYRRPLEKQRCLVIADSFYEWKKIGARKIPYRILLKNEEPFAFAGIYETFQNNGSAITTFSIITTEPNSLMIPLHDRMPVILKKEYERTWLEKPFLEILQPYPSELMKRYQISTLVNNPENDTVDIIKPSEQKTLG